jgi:hypothetical protein
MSRAGPKMQCTFTLASAGTSSSLGSPVFRKCKSCLATKHVDRVSLDLAARHDATMISRSHHALPTMCYRTSQFEKQITDVPNRVGVSGLNAHVPLPFGITVGLS